jgi:hypothetical protein
MTPVQVINKSQENQQSYGEEEGQSSVEEESQESQRFRNLDSSSPPLQSNSREYRDLIAISSKSGPALTAPSSLEDEDLVEVEALRRAKKRRRLEKSRVKSLGTSMMLSRLSHNDHIPPLNIVDTENELSPFNFPESPPQFHRVGVFRPPPPLPSIGNGLSTDHVVRSNSRLSPDGHSESEAGMTPIRSRHGRSTRKKRVVESSEEDRESDEGRDARTVGKILAGVLPRSWVKLDMEQQRQTDKEVTRKGSPKRHNPPDRSVRGIARIKMAAQQNGAVPIDTEFILPIDHEYAGAESSPSLEPTSMSLAKAVDAEDSSSDPGSDMEHDMIDWMAPSKKANQLSKSTVYRKRKIQRRLNEFFPGRTGQMLPDTKTSLVMSLDATTTHGSHWKRHKRPKKRHNQQLLPYVRRAPRIGILDLPEENMLHGSEIPSFLRIARRQARHNQNFGRQSPTKKYIRLPTREDTAEANEVLNKWRKGELKQKELVARNKPPLAVKGRSVNIQHNISGAKSLRSLDYRPLRAQILARPDRMSGQTDNVLVTANSTYITSKSKSLRHQSATSEFRTAQLESLESDFSTRNRKLAFENSLRNAENDYAIRRLIPRALGSEVAKYLGKDENEVDPRSIAPSIESKAPTVKSNKKSRKGIANRLEIRNPEFRQDELDISEETVIITDDIEVQSLSGFAVNYPDDFEILPLPHDPMSHFNSDTFIGRGSFIEAILMGQRDLDKSNGEAQVMLGGAYHLWSAWNEEMANDIQTAFQRYCLLLEGILDDSSPETQLQQNIDSIAAFSEELEAILQTFSRVLYFFDPVDRFTFVSRLSEHLESMIRTTNRCILSPNVHETQSKPSSRVLLRFLLLQLCLTAQVRQVEGLKTTDRVYNILLQCAESITRILFQLNLAEARRSLGRNNDLIEREIGFGKDDCVVEAIVIMNHVLGQTNTANGSLWTVLNRHLVLRVQQANRVASLESVWRDLFTILPILEIEMTGFARLGKRFDSPNEDWVTVRAILDKVFDFYDNQTQRTRAPGFYIRALLRRCHRLIQSWGWSQCESAVVSIFDFFGRHKFQPLFDEETHGSPKFIEMLNDNPVMDLSHADTAFHIFLKILALTLRVMRSRSVEKKLKGVIVRCMPNHNRQYLKEHDLKTVDLEALRNQHDLLCTLFWCSTTDLQRRILDSIRGLVNHRLSHRLVCQLSVKSWTNLIRYILSTDDSIELMDEFSSWMQEVISQGVSQYHLARMEIDEQCHSNPAFGKGGNFERLIKRNQSEVLHNLGDAMFALKTAMNNARNQSQVVRLLESCGIEKLLLFSGDTSQHALNLLLNTLDVYRRFLSLPSEICREVIQKKDESQDYGEWPEDYISIDFILLPIFQFLSNCFGSERALPDGLAKSTIDTWVKTLAIKIDQGEMDWSSVIDSYGEYAWDRLNDTDNKRKYTAYFYSAIIELDQSCLRKFEDKILSVWLVSLVERNSMLKFQHVLTSKLLNFIPDNPLVQNLPFWKEKDNTYHINLENIKSRRLSLLSSIFANMQSLYYDSQTLSSSSESIKQQLTTILKETMNAMKKNYLELRQGNDFGGAYVSFVQELIGFLHQYTVGICQVDRFFTQSSEFPLPEQDPEYVVGKLRGYGTRLKEQGTVHTVAHFLESLCERAVLDDQIVFLIAQLKRATENAVEDGSTLSLRTILLQAIFPAYIDNALSSNAGWLLCLPVLPVLSHLLRSSIYYMNSNNSENLSTTADILMTSLSTIYQSVQIILQDTQLLKHAHILRILGLLFQVASSALSPLDYIQRLSGIVSPARRFVQFFCEFSLFCAESVLGLAPRSSVMHDAVECPTKSKQFREYCANSLKENLRHWHKDGNGYYLMQKSGVRKHVPSIIRSFLEERAMLIEAIEEFHQVLGRMSTL